VCVCDVISNELTKSRNIDVKYVIICDVILEVIEYVIDHINVYDFSVDFEQGTGIYFIIVASVL